MNSKRSKNENSHNKKRKSNPDNVLLSYLENCGLTVKNPPFKHIAHQETLEIVINLKRTIQKDYNYPDNISNIFSSFEKNCKDLEVFKHYLFPNIVRLTESSSEEFIVSDSVVKILLNVPILQDKVIDYIFNKAMDFAIDGKCGPWIKMILKCCTSLQNIDMQILSKHLINLLHITTEKVVKLEIMTSIPDIMGDQEHEIISLEISKLLNEDQELIPAVLDCLSYLSVDYCSQLQRKALHILDTLTKYIYFPNFVKFLLNPGHKCESAYLEIVQGLRSALDWPTSNANMQEIATSQILTASALKSSMISSKVIEAAWMKELTSCKVSTDFKTLDFIILLLLYTISEERQRYVERFIKKQIRLDIIKQELINEVFEKYKPILKEYLHHLIELTNSLLIIQSDTLLQDFTSNLYITMFEELEEYRPRIIAELLQLSVTRKHCMSSILQILSKIANKDMSMLKPQGLQILTLLDRMDDISLIEKRDVINLVCGLAYYFHDSIIKDDVHMIIRKQLSCSNPCIKIQGILAGVYAVKYLMMSTEHSPDSDTDLTDLSLDSKKEAMQIIELISCSTKQFPDLVMFYYDELCSVITNASYIDKRFLNWITEVITNNLRDNFIVQSNDTEKVSQVELSWQYCLHSEDDMTVPVAIDIAGLTLDPKDDVNIGILAPLFKLVQILHSKTSNFSEIDGLLGCGIVMPHFDMDLLDNYETNTISNILDCLIHCANWFRELINAFCIQDDSFKPNVYKRILQLTDIEHTITQILIKSSVNYKPPNCYFNINNYIKGIQSTKSQLLVQKSNKKLVSDDSTLPETITPTTGGLKSKINILHNLPFRPLNLDLIVMFKSDLILNNEPELDIKIPLFLLKNLNCNLETILVSKIKRKTYLAKQECNVYDHFKAEMCAKNVNAVIPNLIKHMNLTCKYIDKHLKTNDHILSSEMADYLLYLENLHILLSIYFKWNGLKHNNVLLKNSLKAFANEKQNSFTLKELFIIVMKYLSKQENYCLQMSGAISLIDLLKALQDLSNDLATFKLLRDVALNFLSTQWKTLDGVLEKGLYFNQCLEKISSVYFSNNNILELRELLEKLKKEMKKLEQNDTLESFKSFNKKNFPILYRNIGKGVYETAKTEISKGISNSDHLSLWMNIINILNDMIEIAKTVKNTHILSEIFKKSLPILTLFISRAMPVIQVLFKSCTTEILIMFKNLQKNTRFLQSLCCHSVLIKDTKLMAKVPSMKQTLEKLIYKVKVTLDANNCSEAFWIGNLKNRNISGETIHSQNSIDNESNETNSEQFPDDDDDDQLPQEYEEIDDDIN